MIVYPLSSARKRQCRVEGEGKVVVEIMENFLPFLFEYDSASTVVYMQHIHVSPSSFCVRACVDGATVDGSERFFRRGKKGFIAHQHQRWKSLRLSYTT